MPGTWQVNYPKSFLHVTDAVVRDRCPAPQSPSQGCKLYPETNLPDSKARQLARPLCHWGCLLGQSHGEKAFGILCGGPGLHAVFTPRSNVDVRLAAEQIASWISLHQGLLVPVRCVPLSRVSAAPEVGIKILSENTGCNSRSQDTLQKV